MTCVCIDIVELYQSITALNLAIHVYEYIMYFTDYDLFTCTYMYLLKITQLERESTTHLGVLPKLNSSHVTDWYSLGRAYAHNKAYRLSIFSHEREFCSKSLLGRHALGTCMLGRTLYHNNIIMAKCFTRR